MFFWTLTVIVSIKYRDVGASADNHGEGRHGRRYWRWRPTAVKDRPALSWLLLIGMFGVALFYGGFCVAPGNFRAVGGRGSGSRLASSNM
jgi:K+ transporter